MKELKPLSKEEMELLGSLLERASAMLGNPSSIHWDGNKREIWGKTTYINNGVEYTHTLDNPKAHDETLIT